MKEDTKIIKEKTNEVLSRLNKSLEGSTNNEFERYLKAVLEEMFHRGYKKALDDFESALNGN
jgi:hypothetical protein